MTIEEIKNTPELVDFMLDESVIADSREKLRKRLEKVCNLAIKALEQESCEDAISRQAVLEYIEGSEAELGHSSENELVCRDIKEFPPVTPQPKIGKWIVDGSVDCYLDKVKCHCSECGKKKEFPANYDHIKQKLSISYKYPEFIDNYCPNCGIKMIESEDKE